MRAARYQEGHVFKVKGKRVTAFYIKYYVTELQDGKPVRVQRTERLCDKDDKHFSETCRAVQQLAAKVMERVNKAEGVTESGSLKDTRIIDFWETVYIPNCKAVNKDGIPNMAASTLNGYEKIYNKHLKPHFNGLTFRQYNSTVYPTQLLTALASTLNAVSLNHVKTVGRSIWKLALRMGYAETNVWADAGSTVTPAKSNGTVAYTLEQAQEMLTLLADQPEAQLLFGLCFFAGLRPGEAQGIQWADFDSGWLRVSRSVWRGQVKGQKTDTKATLMPVPVIKPLQAMLDAWYERCGRPNPDAWVFPNARGGSHSYEYIDRVIIKPKAKEAGFDWYCGLYACRRGASSVLTELTGDALAASYVLRHTTPRTTESKYLKLRSAVAAEGLQALEEKVKGLLPEPKTGANTGA